jgi:hypothetical protein
VHINNGLIGIENTVDQMTGRRTCESMCERERRTNLSGSTARQLKSVDAAGARAAFSALVRLM